MTPQKLAMFRSRHMREKLFLFITKHIGPRKRTRSANVLPVFRDTLLTLEGLKLQLCLDLGINRAALPQNDEQWTKALTLAFLYSEPHFVRGESSSGPITAMERVARHVLSGRVALDRPLAPFIQTSVSNARSDEYEGDKVQRHAQSIYCRASDETEQADITQIDPEGGVWTSRPIPVRVTSPDGLMWVSDGGRNFSIPDPIAENRANLAKLIRVIRKLGKRDQEVLLLRMEGLTALQIGAKLGISEETAKKRIQRAVSRAQKTLNLSPSPVD